MRSPALMGPGRSRCGWSGTPPWTKERMSEEALLALDMFLELAEFLKDARRI